MNYETKTRGWSSPGGLRGLQNRCEALNRLGWVRLPSTPAYTWKVNFRPSRSDFPIMKLPRQCAAFVYLLLCADGSIYTGWALDVARRFEMHQKGRGARYTRTHRPLCLIYQERLGSRGDAMRREAEIKRWPRARKLKLAEKKNTEHRAQNTDRRRRKAKGRKD
jgi:putative endonuclease